MGRRDGAADHVGDGMRDAMFYDGFAVAIRTNGEAKRFGGFLLFQSDGDFVFHGFADAGGEI